MRNLSRARGRILELLANGPGTVSSLAMHTGQHENTIREHLTALVDAGMALKYQDSVHLRGRPAWLYRINEPIEIREYVGLATALAGAIARSSKHPVGDAIEAGKAWAPELVKNSKLIMDTQEDEAIKKSFRSVRRKVLILLDELGFAPIPNADLTRTKLTQCPLLDAARQHPNIICSVHLGIARGALAEFGAPAEKIKKVELEPFSALGACLLRM